MKHFTCVHALTSVVSDSLQPHGLYPTKLLCSWGSPGKNTESEVKWSESHWVMSNSLRAHGLYSPWNSSGQGTGVGTSLLQGIFPTQGCRQILYQLSHRNTGGGCHFLLRGIFLTQGLNLCLLHVLCWQVDSLPLIHLIWKPKSLHSDNFIFFSFLTLTQWFHREIFFFPKCHVCLPYVLWEAHAKMRSNV